MSNHVESASSTNREQRVQAHRDKERKHSSEADKEAKVTSKPVDTVQVSSNAKALARAGPKAAH